MISRTDTNVKVGSLITKPILRIFRLHESWLERRLKSRNKGKDAIFAFNFLAYYLRSNPMGIGRRKFRNSNEDEQQGEEKNRGAKAVTVERARFTS